ncbi:hypothetical protein LTR37_000790 [Vermiconidia calcicola]|uniref:Uncharacterized protein n=1 Tax=Vermiconidia calcicola TaxID=1690605 RepID=A0ACC3NWZ1_9PEZI|nr:hypothetical protein LTR37_000790 [Vermiconidia calcicola]
MEQETLIDEDESTNHDQHEESAFHAPNWQASDTVALLQPSNLGLPKVLRAWDRKPASPFSRQRVRVGKVWKRPVSSSLRAMDENRSLRKRKARTSLQGALKPVKKLCLDGGFGMRARVSRWDASESPTRKIVTRSKAAPEDIVALSEDEDGLVEQQEQDEEATIEFLDEDGTVLDVDPEDDGEEQEWEDEVEVEEDDDGAGEEVEVYDGTMMHLGDAMEHPQPDKSIELPAEEAEVSTLVGSRDGQDDIISHDEAEVITVANDRTDAQLEPSTTTVTQPDSTQPQNVPPSQAVILPDRFVSPVKRRCAAGRNAAGQIAGSRRRTLPVQFAPSTLPDVESFAAAEGLQSSSTGAGVADEEVALDGAVEASDETVEPTPTAALYEGTEETMGHEWEDVDEDAAAEDALNSSVHHSEPSRVDAEGEAENDVVQDYDQECEGKDDHAMEDIHPPGDTADEPTDASTRLPSSPVSTIEGQHPRLPLRRSPRRKSTSPLKQSTIAPSTERSHLIAFTPIRAGPAPYPSAFVHPEKIIPARAAADDSQSPARSTPERAASAPPEEPKMSPRKASRPRISDDTALLQAFLSRAAENKGSRRISASRQESIINRRDSDAVRQALASPAKAEVLGDLDPNSPSPRKASASLVQSDGFRETTADAAKQEQEDSSAGSTKRRSGRATKKAQPSTPGAPNRIAIRGNTEGVVLKRTEAQDLALLVRNNTRKNKGAAVLPNLRLTKMAAQLGNSEEVEIEMEDATSEKPEGVRGVRWAETLVQFYQGGEASEASVLSEESNGAELPAKSDGEMDTSAPAPGPPPPSETPSKPKMRRLRAPSRTAAAPGNTSSAPATAADEPVKNTAPEQQATIPAPKRRSRIATPAKGLTNASLLPSDLDLPQSAMPTEKKPTPAPRKKPASVSKLPAPAPALGQGKENSLISSPPKKKSTAAVAGILPTSKINFAPKLDFGKGATRLEPASATAKATEDQAVPSLLSPAKKGGRTRGVALGANVRSDGEDLGVGKRKEDVSLGSGLSSPAKKRTRRAL